MLMIMGSAADWKCIGYVKVQYILRHIIRLEMTRYIAVWLLMFMEK